MHPSAIQCLLVVDLDDGAGLGPDVSFQVMAPDLIDNKLVFFSGGGTDRIVVVCPGLGFLKYEY